MYWRFFLVNFLLVVPNTRILTSEALKYLDDANESPFTRTDEEIVQDIIDKLRKVEYENDIQQASEVNKKNQPHVFEDTGSNNDGLDLDIQDPNAGQPSPDNHTPDNHTPDSKSQLNAAASAGPQSNTQGSASVHAAPGNAEALQQQSGRDDSRGSKIIDADDKQFIIIVAVAVSTSFVGLMLAGVCYYKFRKSAKAASDVEYPVYGVTGPVKERVPSPGDRKLAQSAQMYHYQHQKQQMIAMEKANGDMKHDASDDDSEEDNIEGDYTVYECPGLAPTGEMEVRNPLFRADDTPVTPGEDITGQPHGQEPPPERGNQ